MAKGKTKKREASAQTKSNGQQESLAMGNKKTVEKSKGKAAKAVQPVAKKPAKQPAKKAKSQTPKVNIFQKSKQFLREVKVELKKVTWPSRKETMASTAVVLILVIIIAAFLGVVDIGLTKFISFLIR
jgi:preprotein translocase subunit SecE